MTTSDRAATGLVVMCCASGDAEPLAETVATLQAEGNDVRVVAGLEADTSTLTDVIGDLQGEGLYVLCRSPRLGREHVEKLREILLAHHVPFARTLTVAVGGRGALADRIRSGLRRASTRGAGPAAVAPPRPSHAAAAPPLTNATEDEEPTLVGLREHPMGDPAPVLAPAEPTPEPDSPPLTSAVPTAVSDDAPIQDLAEAETSVGAVPRPEAEPEPQPGEDTVEHADTLSNPRLSLSELDLSDLDDSIPGARIPAMEPEDRTLVGKPPALITGNTVIGPAPAMITGDTIVGERLPERLRQAAEQAAGAWPSPSSGSPDPTEPATAPFARLSRSAPESKPKLPPPTPAPTLAPAEPQPTASAAVPTPSPAASSMAAASPGPTSTAGPGAPSRPSPLPWVLGGIAVVLLATIITIAAWPSGDDGGGSEVASSTPAADPTPAAKTEAQPEPTDETTEDAPAPPAAGTPVLDALRSRKVRALDVILVASEASGDLGHSAALAYCEGLELEGITGWRLPQIGELGAMSEANMIGRGHYWSLTAADLFGDVFLAWNERRGTAAAHEKDAVALCVRDVSGGGS